MNRRFFLKLTGGLALASASPKLLSSHVGEEQTFQEEEVIFDYGTGTGTLEVRNTEKGDRVSVFYDSTGLNPEKEGFIDDADCIYTGIKTDNKPFFVICPVGQWVTVRIMGLETMYWQLKFIPIAGQTNVVHYPRTLDRFYMKS